jgi:hypothetical protein
LIWESGWYHGFYSSLFRDEFFCGSDSKEAVMKMEEKEKKDERQIAEHQR